MAENWAGLKIFPESIPHLLHWDLAYLWLLQRPDATLPPEWRTRCQAWERLLGHYLLGMLEVRVSPVLPPLLGFTEPYGITEIRKLFYNGILVGVGSPAVIVRPLPDARPELPELPPVPAEKRPELKYMLGLLLDLLTHLSSSGGDRPLQKELRNIVEHLAQSMGPRDATVRWRLRPEYSDFLRHLTFDPAQATHERDVRQISVSSRRGKTRLFVPLCQCGRSLAREEINAESLYVTGDAISLRCPDGHHNELSLSKLFIWYRRSEPNVTPTAVCWSDRESNFVASPDTAEFPPDFRIDGKEVIFTWHSAVMPQYDRERTVLRLRFDGRPPISQSIFADIFYPKLLVPGAGPGTFAGLPIRREWFDAWRSHIRTDSDNGSWWYRGINIAGVPFQFDHLCVAQRVDQRAGLTPAIYPKRMHDAWRPYRVMVVGNDELSCRVFALESRDLLPNLIEVSGWPSFVSVETGPTAGVVSGATWRTVDVAVPEAPPATMRPRVCLGLDFGTSNTVVYFQAQGDAQELSARDNGLSTKEIVRQIHWLGQPLVESWAFPAPANSTQDEYLFSSAMWRLGPAGPFLIRWNPTPPRIDCLTEESFKWDEGITSRHAVRQAYLQEVLFHGLPIILDRLRARGTQPGLEIGCAFPLAFEFAKRRDFEQVIRGLADWTTRELGFEAGQAITNESLAAVRVQGAFNPGDLFLVADMGGRTLDISLFSYQSDPAQQTDVRNMHQIGSMDFGGELFLRSAANAKALSKEDAETEYWKLRDQISSGTAGQGSFDNKVRDLLDRFQPMALEFVRILVEAFRDIHTEARGPIRLLLVGNGWRLRELFAGKLDPASVFERYFGDSLSAMGIEGLLLGDTRVDGIPNSKHWVACGSLYNARQASVRRQAESLSRIPSGLSFHADAQEVKWSTLLGDGGWNSANGAGVQAITFDRASIPKASSSWTERLRRCFGNNENPLPSDARLREALIAGFENSRFRKGPMTIVLENHWKNLLWPH